MSASEEADISLRLGRACARFEHGWGLFATTAYLELVSSQRLEVERLDGLCYLHPQLDTQMGRWTQRHIPEANRRLVTHEVILLKEAYVQGLGVAMLPVPFAAEVETLRPVELELSLPAASPIWLVAHEDVSAVPRIRAVWEFLSKVLRSDWTLV